MMHFVKRVEYVGGYELILTFEDDSIRRADLTNYLDGEIFEPLRDVDYFKTVRVNPDLDTIVWDNGADYAPEFLYEISRPDVKSASAA